MEGSYILRLLRVVPRVRRWRLAAGEGRESRRVVAEAARSDLHTLTHTCTYLRTRISVTYCRWEPVTHTRLIAS